MLSSQAITFKQRFYFYSSTYSSIKLLRLTLLVILLLPSALLAKPLQVSFYADHGAEQRGILRSLMKDFEHANSEVKVELKFVQGLDAYEEKVNQWISGSEGPDIIYWYGGHRLKQYAQTKHLKDLSSFWQKNKLDDAFPSVLSDAGSTPDGHRYGIPLTYYFWSLYYYEPMLEKLAMVPPKTWAEFINSCKTLRQRNIDLISFGSKNTWSINAWFDYINLRTHGTEFYQRLLRGEIPYTDTRVLRSLAYLRELLDNDCFNDNHASYTLTEAFPRLLHGRSLFTLSDGVPPNTPLRNLPNLRLIPFPTINEALPLYTVAPVNMFVVPSYTKDSEALNLLLGYLSSVEFQSNFNTAIHRLAAHVDATESDDPLLIASHKILRNSPGGIQYLDRDSDIDFSIDVPNVLLDFMHNRDMEATSKELEQLRERVFGKIAKDKNTKK